MVTPAVLSPDRQTVITATDSTILMGAVPEMWGTPETVWLDKMGIGIKKRPTLSMFLGHVFEPHIINCYEAGLISKGDPYALVRSPGFTKMKNYPFGCTPDAWFQNAIGTVRHGFEAKSTTSHDEWGPTGSGEVPDRVMIQCQHSMMVEDADRWDVGMFLYHKDSKEEIACLVMEHGDLRPEDLEKFVIDRRFYTLYRNDLIIQRIQDVGLAFWNQYVGPRVRPTPYPNEAVELPALKSPTVVESADLDELIAVLVDAKASAKAATTSVDTASKRIKEELEKRGYGILKGGSHTVALTPITRKATPDMTQAFDAACSLGKLEDSDRELILSNYMKAESISYRLDIKENK